MILLLIEKYIDANDVDISAFLFSVFCFEIKTPQQIKLSSEGLLLAHGLNNGMIAIWIYEYQILVMGFGKIKV